MHETLSVRDSIEGERVFYFAGDEPGMPLPLPSDGYCQAPGNKALFYLTKHFHYSESVIINISYGDKKPSKQSRTKLERIKNH